MLRISYVEKELPTNAFIFYPDPDDMNTTRHQKCY